mgnify:FL=1
MKRQARIVESIQRHGYRSVRELADELRVDESTVRRHLSKLDELQVIQRSHGGASLRRSEPATAPEPPTPNLSEKQAIGRAAAERIHDGQVVLLDAGTTTLEVARSLNNPTLTVITNDLRIGLEVAAKPGIQLMFLGGENLPESTTMWGPTAVQQVHQLRADIAILTGDAINDEGLYRNTSYEIELQRAMLEIASEAFLVVDSSKFHRKALFRMFSLDRCSTIITDKFLNPIRASQLPVPVIRANGF